MHTHMLTHIHTHTHTHAHTHTHTHTCITPHQLMMSSSSSSSATSCTHLRKKTTRYSTATLLTRVPASEYIYSACPHTPSQLLVVLWIPVGLMAVSVCMNLLEEGGWNWLVSHIMLLLKMWHKHNTHTRMRAHAHTHTHTHTHTQTVPSGPQV